jgi:stress-induced-phosphoprotein 1
LAPSDHILYSNRSGSYASLHKYQEALDDASKCIELNPQFVKGYQRKGLAQFYLDDFEDAIESYKKGLQIDPNNQPLKDGLKAAEERLSSEPDPLDFGGAGGNNPFGEVLKNPNI